MVPYLKILRPKPEELQRIWRWLGDLPSSYQRGLCNAVEASLVRVNNDLMRRHDSEPRRKPGPKKGQKRYDDKAAVKAALELTREPNPPSIYQAAKMVVDEGLSDKGISPDADIARVYKLLLREG